MSVAALVLAAGASRRMGRPKALLPHGGSTFLGCVAGTACEAGLDPLVVVVGAAAQSIAATHPELVPRLVINDRPDLGQLHSLRLGLARLGAGVEAAVVLPVDHPLVTSDTVRALVAAFAAQGAPIVLPTYGGRRGHPTLFARAVFDELGRAPLVEGARAIVRRDPDRVCEVPVDDPGILANVDTPEAYGRMAGDERRA
jgi:molybdenum cofactor cytidylyltransferase